MSVTGPETEQPAGAWAPLRVATYRSLWLGLLAANIGTWMQTVGAQWLLVHDAHARTLVPLVQTATLLPILLLALPSGALADTFDRRRLLLAVQGFLIAVGLLLTALTVTGHMTPALLLTLTFGLGVGQALTQPAWAASIPDLVPRNQLHSAAALGSVSINLARAVGPAVAGFLVARAGVGAVFAVNAASLLIFGLALLRWRPQEATAADVPERFTAALRAGGRFVRHSNVVRRLLLRATLFVVPASIVWALLPLIASQRLGRGSGGYGLLLAALGVGAIVGALALPRVRAITSGSQLQLAAGLVFGAALFVVALVRDTWIVAMALVPAGMAWTTASTSVTVAIQLYLPGWVRARGMAAYQVVFAGAQGLAALAWGVVAEVTNLVAAYLAAAVLMIFGALSVRLWPVHDIASVGREAAYWPRPRLALEPEPGTGPVLVIVTYTLAPEREAEFVAAMQHVRRSRQRTGAIRWGLFRSGEAVNRFVEVYQVASWDEHLRQHSGRLTGADRLAEERAWALAEGEPEVHHLLPAMDT
jgi:MFS family permease/quinol monooxygenase YgiN